MKLITNFDDLKNEVVVGFGHEVVQKTNSSSYLKNGSTLTGPLNEALTTLDKNISTILYPTPADTVERDGLRKAVKTELSRLALQLNLDYSADESALISSGLPLAAPGGAHARKPGELDPPTDLELLDGSTSGCLLVRSKRPTGTVQNLIRASYDPAVPAEAGTVFVGGGREREIGPFPSGAVVSVVWACLTSASTAPNFSAPVSRRVQ